jgi:monoamine oxidase
MHSDLSRPEGRLHFAGADVSFGRQLWMEGAFETAFQVADRLR